MLLLTSDCSGYLVILPAPLIRCLCVDFVRVTIFFYDLRLRLLDVVTAPSGECERRLKADMVLFAG